MWVHISVMNIGRSCMVIWGDVKGSYNESLLTKQDMGVILSKKLLVIWKFSRGLLVHSRDLAPLDSLITWIKDLKRQALVRSYLLFITGIIPFSYFMNTMWVSRSLHRIFRAHMWDLCSYVTHPLRNFCSIIKYL